MTDDKNTMVNIKVVDGGYYLKTTPTHRIYALRMLFNWRVVTQPIGWDEWMGYDRGWCYFGLRKQTLTALLLAVNVWDGSPDTEPIGYSKRVF